MFSSSLTDFRKLMVVYLFWSASWIIAGGLFELYLFQSGVPISEIYLVNSFWFLASLILPPLFKGFNARLFMLLGIVTAFSASAVLFLYPGIGSAYLFRLLIGVTQVFFWIPFNVLYYEFSKDNNARMGAMYYSLSPALSLVIPALSGLLVSSLGFPALFLAAMVSYTITFFLGITLLPNKNYKYDFFESIKSIDGLKSIFFLEGFSVAVMISLTIDLVLLLYIDRPLDFGIFVSLATIFSIVASVVTAHFSDKIKDRRKFILPSVAFLGLSAIMASISQELGIFFFFFGMINFFSRIFLPLPLALSVDNSKSIVSTMLGREFLLNLGRFSGALIGYIIIFNSDIKMALLFQGVAILLYIPIFEAKKKKLEKH